MPNYQAKFHGGERMLVFGVPDEIVQKCWVSSQ